MIGRVLPSVRLFQKVRSSVAEFASIDIPLALAVSTRIWAIVAGFVTLAFITRNLTSNAQGYYFTFGSLSQLTTLVDLGLQILVLQFASHEAAHLTFGRKGAISGPDHAIERLVSLARFSLAWFGILSLILVPGMFGVGYWLFSEKSDALPWRSPWLLLCILVAIDLILNNFVWLLEGTNQLKLNYAYRLLRGIVTPLTLWISLEFGLGLFAIPMGVFTGILSLLAFLAVTSPEFVLTFFRVRPSVHKLSWLGEIMPLQWRLGVSQVTSFVTYSLFVPVTFRFVGPVAAGQVGLSWSVVEAVTGIAIMWLAVKFPSMGGLAARRAWKQLDHMAYSVALQSAAIAALGATGVIAFTYGLEVMHSRYAERLLPLLPMALFAYAAVPKLIFSSMISYLRAHRVEPIVYVTAIMTPLMLTFTIAGAKEFGTIGVAAGYFLIMTFFMLPATTWVTIRYRARLHTPAAEARQSL